MLIYITNQNILPLMSITRDDLANLKGYLPCLHQTQRKIFKKLQVLIYKNHIKFASPPVPIFIPKT